MKVACDNNIFFDVSDLDFTIGTPDDPIFRTGFERVNTVQDPGFEATTADGGSNPSWQGVDTNGGGTSFYSATNITPRTGNWGVWFGGWGAVGTFTQSASQDVVLEDVYPLYFNYWRRTMQQGAGTGDVFTVEVDGHVVASVDASTLAIESQYSPHSVDISAYADGNVHTVKVQFVHASSGDDADLYLDDTSISMTPIEP